MILVVAALIAYLPALHGGILWDDPAHIPTPDLQSLHGLFRIWFEPGATQQYYPLLYSAFWLEHVLWGDGTFGYHLVNVVLHAGVASLLWLVLRRLKMPGAWLAAAIFLLHPVEVESVAWISELKNTMSAFFYLAAMWCYLEFDDEHDRRWYRAAIALFVLGLLTKTVIATLPAALLVIAWWQRGKLSWRRDVRPVLPFFALALVAGLTTAWLEYTMVGAHGPEYQMSAMARALLAGRVVWFYLASLAWPAHLIFFYPRWQIDPAQAWQWAFPVALVLLVVALWLWRAHTRAPLAALLFFVGSLFPVLGFVNVYPFRFSYVADHFQYLASIGIVVLVAGALAWLHGRASHGGKQAVEAACAALLLVLGLLTWRQSGLYGADAATLYRAVIARNPASWLAHENLGGELLAHGDAAGGMAEMQVALQYHPQYAHAYYTLAQALVTQGKQDEALEDFQKSIAIDSEVPEVQFTMGGVLGQMGRAQEAAARFAATIRLQPGLAEAHFDLGAMEVQLGDSARALSEFEAADRLEPGSAEMQRRLATAYYALGDAARANAAMEKAQRLVGSNSP
ncbi:MAG TPA: tetratricopeptide repeat protein [Gemmatimonadales bacterium]|nr:tetratricopeptide repeat protein [Gemmatimonadales bacterium]